MMNILAFIETHQLYIMWFMSGICAALAFLTTRMKTLSDSRRRILMMLEIASALLLFNDSLSYIYYGNVSVMGYWMVRITNFMVFFCTLSLPYILALYVSDLCVNEGGMKNIPKRLTACSYLFVIGLVLLVISQFTGLYYTFDSLNVYHRSSSAFLCYLIPLLIMGLLFSILVSYRDHFSDRAAKTLTLYAVIPVVASIVQFLFYGISLTSMTMVGMAIYLYVCALYDMNDSIEIARAKELKAYREIEESKRILFEQTAAALASAIDAKDEYTHGHSSRVATYSQLIAQEAGLSAEEVEQVYFAALLHDVGKIGIDDAVINKNGRLTDEEYAQMKMHTVYGSNILSRIYELPYLSVGAHYHHERYDGRGYPEGLVGKDIPRLARIISVADAYDAMTSQRSYRDIRPQHLVRQEILKGIGTQFDPKYAKIMLHCMDLDFEYNMHQKLKDVNADFVEGLNAELETELRCDELYHECSTGIRILDKINRFHLVCTSDEGFDAEQAQLTLILFDSLDGMVHQSDSMERNRRYFEYARIGASGNVVCDKARKVETSVIEASEDADIESGVCAYDVEAVRFYDHVQIRLSDGRKTVQTIVALPFPGRFSYLAFTGEHCTLSEMRVVTDDEAIDEAYIPRIAEEISYIKDCPEGDIPNIQINGYRADISQSILLEESLRLSFHAQSLPNARIVWHCPYISIFTSDDGTVDGDEFGELLLVRLDGEELIDNIFVETDGVIERTDEFVGWDTWLEKLKEGIDCEVIVSRDDDVLTVSTENLGISINSKFDLPDDIGDLYVAFTGDQCSITNIKVQAE